jgi:hypothetical protein
MISSGSLEREIELAPRIRICCAVPVVPDEAVTDMPGTRAVSRSWRLDTGADSTIEAAFTDATTAEFARRSTAPAVPVTTTSSSATAEVESRKSAAAAAPAATVTVTVWDA